MSPLGRILGLILPACAAAGANGLLVPPLLDVAHIERPASPNTALAAPAGWAPTPDIVTPVYPLPADRLLTAVGRVAAARPRTFPAAAYPEARQLHWVVRSAVFNFPDLVTAQAMPREPAGSTLLLYSRSVYGYGDFGVNRQRLTVWLAALDNAVRQSTERPPPL
jgi:uncharacterized protein (DUF1499 family)